MRSNYQELQLDNWESLPTFACARFYFAMGAQLAYAFPALLVMRGLTHSAICVYIPVWVDGFAPEERKAA
eukprot:3868652-Amphidinium_carterae.1